MKMKSVLLVCLMLIASRALCQSPERLSISIVAKQTNGLPYCGALAQSVTFKGGYGTQKYVNDIKEGTYQWIPNGSPICAQPVVYNQFIIESQQITRFPSYLSMRVEEVIYPFILPETAYREVTYALSAGTLSPSDYIVHRNTNPVAPHEGGIFKVVDGYIFTSYVVVPKLPPTGFNTYNDPARPDANTFDRFCYGDMMYVDTFYKRPGTSIQYSRFRYELTIPGQRTRTFTTSDVTGNYVGGIPIADALFPDITNAVTAKLRVQMIGPLLEFGNEGITGPWSDPKDIIIYPRPPQVNTAGLNPGVALIDHASTLETSTNGSVTLHHVACNNGTTGQIIINKLTDFTRYHVFVDNTTTHEHMDYKVNWSPTAGHPITLPDDGFNDDPNSNTEFRFRAGDYVVKIQTIDPMTGLDFGCFSTQGFTIKQAQPLQLSASPLSYNGFNVPCRADNITGQPSAGIIEMTPAGGIVPYTFSLSSSAGLVQQRTQPGITQFPGLPPLIGATSIIYNATAVDAEGCAITAVPPPITMTVPSKITIQAVDVDFVGNLNNNIRCFGGTGDTQAFIEGGTHVFTSWIDGNGYTDYQHKINIIESLTQVRYDGLIATTLVTNYTLHAVDQNGCHSTLDFTFKQPDKLVFESSVITPVDCFGSNTGSISVNATGGIAMPGDQYKYSLTGFTDQTAVDAPFGSLIKGTYNIKITDVQGCSQAYPLIVAEPPAIALTTTPTDVICFGNSSGTAKATFSGGTAPYVFDWLDGDKGIISSAPFTTADNNTITDRNAGQYYARITDAHSCVKENVFIIAQPSAPLDISANPGDVLGISCNGTNDGKVTVQVNGGWSPYSIGENLASLQPNGFIRSNLTPGSHAIYVSDLRGCVDSFDVVIDEPTPLVVSPDDLRPVSCFGNSDGAFTPNISGGTAPYQVFDNTRGWIAPERIGGLATGNFQVAIRDSRACPLNASILIPTPQALTATLASTIDTKCGEANGGAQVNVAGGTLPYSGEWRLTGKVMSTEVNPIGLPAGLYDVIIKDVNNCQVPLHAGITSSDGPVISIQGTTPTTCSDSADGTAVTTANGGTLPYTSITWTTGETGLQAVALEKGPNFIAVEDKVGCISTKQVDVEGPDPIVGTFTPTLPKCFGDKNGGLVAEGSGGTGPYKYQWVNTSNLTNQISSLGAGEYSISITDVRGCNSETSYDLGEPDPVAVDLTGEELLCTGQRAVLDAGNPGSSYKWTSTNGFTSTERVIEARTTGEYTVVVTDPRGCKGTDTFELRVEANVLQADFLAASEVFAGDTVIFINITFPLPDASSWEFPDGGEIIGATYYTEEVVFDEPGEYTATLVATKGECRDQHDGMISVIEDPGTEDDDSGRKSSLVRSFNIHPNPSNGKFTVTVELSEAESIALDIISMNAVSTQARFSDYGKKYYEMDVQLNVSPGMYTVVLMAGGERLVRRIIIY